MSSITNIFAALLRRLSDETARSYVHFRYSSQTITRAGAVSFCVLLILELALADEIHWGSIGVRALGIGMWLMLYMVVRIETRPESRDSLYWILILNFCIPFALLLPYFLYSLNPPVDTTTRFYVAVTYFIALCIYTQLANSFLGAALGLTASTLSALLIVSLMGDEAYTLALESMTILLSQQLTAVLIGSVTNRNPEIARFDSYSAARRVGHKIANDLRNPLGDIRARAQAAGRSLPQILQGYEAALANGFQPENTLSARQLEVIKQTHSDIENESKDAETLIDMLLVNISEEPIFGQAFSSLRADELVQSAHARFPYANERERALVSLNLESDFIISGPRLLLTHVLFNMIKNALYYVQRAEKGDVTISVRAMDESNPSKGGSINVYDTGPGIQAGHLSSVFNRFFTTTETGRGSGIGLHFCKTIIENLGGKITVQSSYGEWTQFTIHFPEARVPEILLEDRD